MELTGVQSIFIFDEVYAATYCNGVLSHQRPAKDYFLREELVAPPKQDFFASSIHLRGFLHCSLQMHQSTPAEATGNLKYSKKSQLEELVALYKISLHLAALQSCSLEVPTILNTDHLDHPEHPTTHTRAKVTGNTKYFYLWHRPTLHYRCIVQSLAAVFTFLDTMTSTC